MAEQDAPSPRIPEAVTVPRRRTRLSPVWLVPIVAALAGGWVAVTRIMDQGPEIKIIFHSAEGLEAGKTKILFNGVDVGTLMSFRLSDDHQQVIAHAQMAPKTEAFLVEDTQFWIVRARISGANVTGLGTLISGAYVGMDIGRSKTSKREFVALDAPPIVTGNVQGRMFLLKTQNLGSLDTGTPIFFRRFEVGEVASYKLDEDGRAITVKAFVKAPYDQYVNPNTRFWQASGIDVSLDANGLTVQTQSILSVLIGGIAFETPASGPVLPPAEANTSFTLFDDRTRAFELPAQNPQTYLLEFKESVRGLKPGAPVEFKGIPVGEVTAVNAELDAKTFAFTVPVTIRLEAERLGVKVADLPPGMDIKELRKNVLDSMVAHGVRAQLRTGSLITGALFIALDIFPDAPPVTLDWSEDPVRLPTIPGELAAIENNVASIIKKVDSMPLKQIGENLDKSMTELDRTLASARGTLDSARTTIDNADKLVQPNSVLGAELGNALSEVSRAARSLRVLTDYLERHPESLLRGKGGDAN